MAKGL